MLEFARKCGQGAYVEAWCVALGSRDPSGTPTNVIVALVKYLFLSKHKINKLALLFDSHPLPQQVDSIHAHNYIS